MPNIPDQLRELLNKSEWTSQEKKWLQKYLATTRGEELSRLLEEKFRDQLAKISAASATSAISGEGADPEGPAPGEEEVLQRIHLSRDLDTTRAQPSIPLWKHSLQTRPLWTHKTRIIRRLTAAAAVLLIISFAAYRFLNKQPGHQTQVPIADTHPASVKPIPADKPTLTLADGSTVVLDEARDGQLTRQGDVQIIKLKGKLSYASGTASNASPGSYGSTPNPSGTAPGGPLTYNTLATPRGRQFQLELPDGSLVVLNAASSIRFPTAFSGAERRVTITGEAWLEIAKNTTKPFFVDVRGSEIQVLGTTFNISAYEDESILKTTLIEGSVRFLAASQTANAPKANAAASSALLQPGQQAQLDPSGKMTTLNNIDLNEVMAWKRGLFHFDSENIRFVMNQLSRWYDIEVVYGNEENTEHFSADIPRNTSLTDVLKALALTRKVRFRQEGKKVFVL